MQVQILPPAPKLMNVETDHIYEVWWPFDTYSPLQIGEQYWPDEPLEPEEIEEWPDGIPED
jgi:hypothetical protein